MQAKVAITLIVCGTIVAVMPAVLYCTGAPLQDGGFLIYLGLATGMVVSGIVGSFQTNRPSAQRGFEPIMHRPPDSSL